jgi:hypothetical protein
MFLIEYEKGRFINGESIDALSFRDNGIEFWLKNEGNASFYVENDLADTFLNHLQALNDNILNIQAEAKRHKTN